MIKHQALANELNGDTDEDYPGSSDQKGTGNSDANTEFNDLEEELKNFSITLSGDLKPRSGSLSFQPPPMQPQGFARDHSERF